MRILAIVAIIGAFLSITTYAWAGAKPTRFFWLSPHWDQGYSPYIEDSRISHNSRWEQDEWTPQDWVKNHGSTDAVIGALTKAHIISEFDNTPFLSKWRGNPENHKLPVLKVGYGFQHLSSLEKRRVVQFVDYAYDVQGAMVLKDAKTRVPVGIYTELGLQLN